MSDDEDDGEPGSHPLIITKLASRPKAIRRSSS